MKIYVKRFDGQCHDVEKRDLRLSCALDLRCLMTLFLRRLATRQHTLTQKATDTHPHILRPPHRAEHNVTARDDSWLYYNKNKFSYTCLVLYYLN